jgi:class 3 adenylate cyclase
LIWSVASSRTYLREDGLPNDFVNGILSEGDSCLWISTDNGLSRMVIQNDRFNNFFRRDGLPANEFNRISFFKSRNGTFYFGGLNGITSFQPGPDYGLRRKRQDRKLLFTYFSKYDGDKDSIIKWTTSLSEAEGIRLSYQDKFFIFGFALADYASPRENLYSYKLEGYENSWSEPTTNNSAKYNNIPAGRYTFKVRAATAEEDWNEEVLSVPVFIEQAYYKSSWFIALCLGILILLVYGIMRLRIYQFRKRQKQLEDQVRIRTIELEHEKKKSEDLLLNILPAETAEELKANGTAKAKRYDHVTVMFTDFKGFTKIAEKLEPEDLVAEVDYCFRAFDEIIELYGLEKIKTIGDAYLCVGGLTGSASESAGQVVKAALEIQTFMKAIAFERTLKGTPYFETRIGIHTGPIVAGIVGIKKFAYDIWGDTVNIASHLESKAEVGKVNVSSTTHSLVENHFQCKHRGKITAKNKGEVDMYYVEGVL